MRVYFECDNYPLPHQIYIQQYFNERNCTRSKMISILNPINAIANVQFRFIKGVTFDHSLVVSLQDMVYA